MLAADSRTLHPVAATISRYSRSAKAGHRLGNITVEEKVTKKFTKGKQNVSLDYLPSRHDISYISCHFHTDKGHSVRHEAPLEPVEPFQPEFPWIAAAQVRPGCLPTPPVV